MIKLSDILNEGTVVLKSTDNKSDLASVFPDFLVTGGRQTYSGQPVIQFIPRKLTELDKIDQLGDTSKDDITKQLVKYAEKKTKLKFQPMYNYEGAGYGILLDIDFIIKKIS